MKSVRPSPEYLPDLRDTLVSIMRFVTHRTESTASLAVLTSAVLTKEGCPLFAHSVISAASPPHSA